MFIFFITYTLASHLNILLLLISEGFHFMALDQPHYWQQSGCQTHRQYMNMVLKRYFIWTAGLSSLHSHCQRPVQNTPLQLCAPSSFHKCRDIHIFRDKHEVSMFHYYWQNGSHTHSFAH
jgi:hypothetical protein